MKKILIGLAVLTSISFAKDFLVSNIDVESINYKKLNKCPNFISKNVNLRYPSKSDYLHSTGTNLCIRKDKTILSIKLNIEIKHKIVQDNMDKKNLDFITSLEEVYSKYSKEVLDELINKSSYDIKINEINKIIKKNK